MWPKIKIEILAAANIFLFINSCQAQYIDENSLPRLRGPELYGTKSATKALLIGLGPGLFVHGWGHFYIGDKKTGGWLLASECMSVAMSYYLAMAAVGATDYPETRKKIENALTFTAVVFVVGWVYDFVDAPNVVIDSREALKMKPSLTIVPEKRTAGLGLAVAF